MDPIQLIERSVTESLRVKTRFFEENKNRILQTAATLAESLRKGQKVLFFGNGGSAAEAQHMAAELVGRFDGDRPALPAISLATDTSILTAIGNDYGFDRLFARQIEAMGSTGDIAVAISTSGNSPSVIAGIEAARAKGLYTVGFSGETGGKMKNRVDVLFCVPSRNTARIQETHILLGHVLCELVDRSLFPGSYGRD